MLLRIFGPCLLYFSSQHQQQRHQQQRHQHQRHQQQHRQSFICTLHKPFYINLSEAPIVLALASCDVTKHTRAKRRQTTQCRLTNNIGTPNGGQHGAYATTKTVNRDIIQLPWIDWTDNVCGDIFLLLPKLTLVGLTFVGLTFVGLELPSDMTECLSGHIYPQLHTHTHSLGQPHTRGYVTHKK